MSTNPRHVSRTILTIARDFPKNFPGVTNVVLQKTAMVILGTEIWKETSLHQTRSSELLKSELKTQIWISPFRDEKECEI